MKKKLFCFLFASAVASGLLVQSPAQAADAQLAMTGSVTTGSCSIDVDQSTLDWGKISTASLSNQNGWISGRHFLADKKTKMSITCDSPMTVGFKFAWDKSTALNGGENIGLGLTPDNQQIGTTIGCISCTYGLKTGDRQDVSSAMVNGKSGYLLTGQINDWESTDGDDMYGNNANIYSLSDVAGSSRAPTPLSAGSIDLHFLPQISSDLNVTDDVTFSAPVTISLVYL